MPRDTPDGELIACAMPSCVAKREAARDVMIEAAECLAAEAESIRMAYKIKKDAAIVANNSELRTCQRYERLVRALRRYAL